MGQRVAKTVGAVTTHYIYDLSGALIAEADGGTGAAAAEYVALEGMKLAYIATGSIYFVHVDHLGTPQVLTDGTAAVAWSALYAPFGAVEETGALAFNLRFPGQYHDRETGYYQNGFRDYDPSTGRYIQSDPIGLRGGWNTYGYVGGNPVKFTDPMGLAQICCKKIFPWFAPGYYHCSIRYTDPNTQQPTTVGVWARGGHGKVEYGNKIDKAKKVFDEECGPDDPNQDQCIAGAASAYPSKSMYGLVGSNSNTFAGCMGRSCKLTWPSGFPRDMAPGSYGSEAKPYIPGGYGPPLR